MTDHAPESSLMVALSYIARPSIGTPAEFYDDIEGWIDLAPEQNIRIALKACIRVARHAIAGSQE